MALDYQALLDSDEFTRQHFQIIIDREDDDLLQSPDITPPSTH